MKLWFDVGIKRYTTLCTQIKETKTLWFDVGIKRYTTSFIYLYDGTGCGLMWESKDIQHRRTENCNRQRCGLMWESKDIQRYAERL